MIQLEGLEVKTFLHPGEATAWNALMRAGWLKKLLSWIGKQETRIQVKTVLLGDAVQITGQELPKICNTVKEVCETLDFSPVPQVYLKRECTFTIRVFYDEVPIIVIPEFLLRSCDDDMLRFVIGRSITDLKKEQVQLEMMLRASVPIIDNIPGVGAVALPIIESWMRKADLTADRGGLLACQDFWQAEKTLLRFAGMPVKFLTPDCLPHYIRSYRSVSTVSDLVQSAQTLYKTESWKNDRIVELFNWHSSGAYDDLIEEYE